MRSELVGREHELAVLQENLTAAVASQPRLVLCRGEPGIGKTRLAQELSSRAAAKEVSVVWGRADDSAGAPPYWPWRQMLRGMSTIADTAAIAEEHRLTADLSPLAPDHFAETVDQPTGSASIEDRFRQFDAVRELLRKVTLRRPLVIVFDDAHAADEGSLLLLHHLTRGLTDERLLLIVNQRSTEKAHWVLEIELLRQPITTQLDLRGLGAPAVARQLTSLVGHGVPDLDVAHVHSATGGNPFFVTEMGRMLVEGEPAASTALLTTDVRAAVKARLDRLTPGCLRLLQAASVIGQEFDLTVVAAMLDVPALDCLGPLDEAVAAGLVEAASAATRHRVTHAIIRDAIEAGLTTADRVLLHRKAAEALEDIYAGRVAPHLFDLARHWSISWVLGESARAAGWILRAGEAAMDGHAYEEAARLFRVALDVWAGATDDIGRCRVLLQLGAA